MYLAQNIKYLREQKGMTQESFASMIGEIGQKAVSKWETGENEPELRRLIKIAKFFGVSLDDLVLKDLRPPVPLYVNNLKFLRKSHGLTQEDMAKFLGYKGRQGYNEVENGKVKLNVDDLEKLADFFGVSMDQIIKQDLSQEVV